MANTDRPRRTRTQGASFPFQATPKQVAIAACCELLLELHGDDGRIWLSPEAVGFDLTRVTG